MRLISAVLLMLALAAAGAPVRAGTLTVTDPSDPGTVGNNLLSLSEAIRVAAGDLSPAALSPSEGGNINGPVGAGVADSIGFAVTSIQLAGQGGVDVLPTLGGGQDTIDGGGTVVLDGSGIAPGPILWALRITSSGTVIQGLTFNNVPGMVIFVIPPAGGTITGTRILGNHIIGGTVDGIRLVAAQPGASGETLAGGTIDDTLVQGNTIESGSPGRRSTGVNVMAAYAPVPSTITGARITNCTFDGNVIQDEFEGLFARGAVGVGTLTGNELANLTFQNNLFQRIDDQVLYVAPATVNDGGSTADNVAHHLVITANTFQTRVYDPNAPYLGGGPFVSGGFLDNCANTTGSASSARDVTSDVEISNNTILDRAPYGIYLQGAQSCGGAGGSLVDARLEDVRVTGNTIRSSGVGISAKGTAIFQTGPGINASGNTATGLLIEGNTIESGDVRGIEIVGGTGDSVASTVSDVRVYSNTLTGNALSMAVSGAIPSGARCQGNVVSGLRIRENQISGGTGLLLQGAENAQGSGNRIDAPEIAANTLQSLQSIALLLDGSGSGTRANTVTDAVILGNTIDDVSRGKGARGMGISLRTTAVRTARLEANTITRTRSYGIFLKGSKGHTLVDNQVQSYGQPFRGSKRRNTFTGNRFARMR
ncbi:MAG: right-handed parallel beta-helix repeat-containing protein [Candidatus Binatia bacterium]